MLPWNIISFQFCSTGHDKKYNNVYRFQKRTRKILSLSRWPQQKGFKVRSHFCQTTIFPTQWCTQWCQLTVSYTQCHVPDVKYPLSAHTLFSCGANNQTSNLTNLAVDLGITGTANFSCVFFVAVAMVPSAKTIAIYPVSSPTSNNRWCEIWPLTRPAVKSAANFS